MTYSIPELDPVSRTTTPVNRFFPTLAIQSVLNCGAIMALR